MNEPLISLVCSTIGRPESVRRLLDSIAASDVADRIEFVLVDQSPDHACIQVLKEQPPIGPWLTATSARGASVGRNVGTGLANAPVVAYPDDNCWYPPDTVRKVLGILDERPDLAGVSAQQVTSGGTPSMLRWLDRELPVTRTNFMRTSICSTMFLRRSSLPSPAPFDEGIGTGSAGWRGAGEESDLLLRIIAAGHTVLYRPDLRVYQDDDRNAITDEFVAKMLKYGVGIGHLWRRHRLSTTQLGYHSARKLAGSGIRAARGERTLARSDIAYLRGVLAGWRGVSP